MGSNPTADGQLKNLKKNVKNPLTTKETVELSKADTKGAQGKHKWAQSRRSGTGCKLSHLFIST